QRGSALIHVPPGLNGAKIITPTASAAILGDVIAMRVDDRGATQVVALSKDERGPIRVTFNKTGESRTLKAGEMLTVDPNDSRLRDPTPINVEVFTHTSGLIQNFKTPLTPTAQSEILATQHEQAQDMQNGEYENQKSAPDSGSSNQTTSPATVQATVGSNFAGTYTGQLKDLPPCSPQTSQMTVTFQPDGTFSGTTTKISGTDSFTGQMKADGTFTVYTSNGSVVHGAAQIGSNTISGRGNDGVCDSVFTVKK
ncbi:MAG: hypothetical protein JO317_03000, partial [Verrucomicrobiae bacterium]|nr:hypothetical protein [Verrucomicrobiae bacterium]